VSTLCTASQVPGRSCGLDLPQAIVKIHHPLSPDDAVLAKFHVRRTDGICKESRGKLLAMAARQKSTITTSYAMWVINNALIQTRKVFDTATAK
jgi:hypothetical protein